MHINKISNVKSLMLSPVFDSFAMSKYILSMGFPVWGITLQTGSTFNVLPVCKVIPQTGKPIDRIYFDIAKLSKTGESINDLT